MTNESAKKHKLVREVNALPGGYARRIEDKWAVGVLDLVLKLPTHPLIWAEGKIVDGNIFAPTLRQYEEGQRIIRAGMPALLFGWKNSTMFVSPWTRQADIRTCIFGGPPWLSVVQDFLTKVQPHEFDDNIRDKQAFNGSMADISQIAQALKFALRRGKNWDTLSMGAKEVLELMATRIARILSGDPNSAEHWNKLAALARAIGKPLEAPRSPTTASPRSTRPARRPASS